MASLDAHARPPESIRRRYKRYQKLALRDINLDDDIFDTARHSFAGCLASSFHLPDDIQQVLARFLSQDASGGRHVQRNIIEQLRAYEHPRVPGLIIIPSLLSEDVQLRLLDKLLHRDLSNPIHKTNLHMHYNVAYPASSRDGETSSFFNQEALDIVQEPKDPSIHKPLSTASCLNRKLRWVTLGGQYDWTQKVYPSTPPPIFPQDVAALVEGLFPAMKAQAAIVNLYTPGDTLSLHRDVSEECDRPLVSISLGCDGLFIAGLDDSDLRDQNADTLEKSSNSIVMRLRSGDAVIMSGPARYAWHGVPQILSGTCPEWMQDWPAQTADGEPGHDSGDYEHWRGWMAKKRINLNVRQMWD